MQTCIKHSPVPEPEASQGCSCKLLTCCTLLLLTSCAALQLQLGCTGGREGGHQHVRCGQVGQREAYSDSGTTLQLVLCCLGSSLYGFALPPQLHISELLAQYGCCVSHLILCISDWCWCLFQVLDVADDTISIRSLDWDRDRFDIEFGLQEGTTYNSFLIFGDKTCLVDASHEKFRDLYMKTLKDQLAERGRTLDYIVVSHTEPDHSGEPPCVLALYASGTTCHACTSLVMLVAVHFHLVKFPQNQSLWYLAQTCSVNTSPVLLLLNRPSNADA